MMLVVFQTKGGESECRYGLFDFEYDHQCQGTTDTSKKQKLFLMSWCPDTARIKKKMLYSSSFDALKKALVGVHKYIQVRWAKMEHVVTLYFFTISFFVLRQLKLLFDKILVTPPNFLFSNSQIPLATCRQSWDPVLRESKYFLKIPAISQFR
jgi:hypothetical protein